MRLFGARTICERPGLSLRPYPEGAWFSDAPPCAPGDADGGEIDLGPGAAERCASIRGDRVAAAENSLLS